MLFSKKLLTVVLVVILIGLVLYVFVFRRSPDSDERTTPGEAAEEKEAPAEAPIPIKVTEAVVGDLTITLKSPGEAVTDRRVTVKSEVSGIVKSLLTRESQPVRKGDMLLELDDKEYKLDLESAEADRLQNLSELLLEKQFSESEGESLPAVQEKMYRAEVEYERARISYREGKISEEEFQEAYKRFEMALIESGEMKEEIMAAAKGLSQSEIRVKKARMDLEKTKITAPFSGVVFGIKVSPSEHLPANSELFSLVNLDRIQVHAKVLESEVGKIKAGRNASLRFSSYPDQVFRGRVAAVSPVINPEDRSCNVIVDVDNPRQEIKPGMHAEVELVTEIHQNKLLVPQDAVLTREGRKLVFVVEEGLAKWRYVQVGLENEDFAEILPSERATEGVREGEAVIIDGHFTLAHDAKVRIVE